MANATCRIARWQSAAHERHRRGAQLHVDRIWHSVQRVQASARRVQTRLRWCLAVGRGDFALCSSLRTECKFCKTCTQKKNGRSVVVRRPPSCVEISTRPAPCFFEWSSLLCAHVVTLTMQNLQMILYGRHMGVRCSVRPTTTHTRVFGYICVSPGVFFAPSRRPGGVRAGAHPRGLGGG